MTMNSNSPRYSRLAICSTMAKKSQRAKFSLVKAIIPIPAECAHRKWIHIPAAIIPTPCRWLVLVFPGLPLGLGHVSRCLGGRKGSGGEEKYREHQGRGGPSNRRSGGRPGCRSRALNLPNASHGK